MLLEVSRTVCYLIEIHFLSHPGALKGLLRSPPMALLGSWVYDWLTFFTFINTLLHRLFTNWGMNLWRKADYLFSFVFLQFCFLSSLLITFSLCLSVRGVVESWRVLETAMCHLWTVWRRRTGSWGWKLLSCELAWRPTTRPGRTSTRERYYKIRTRMLRTGTCY